MRIDHVMLINLKRREDKWFFALGWLNALGYPVHGDEVERGDNSWSDRIIRFEARDGQDYKDTQSVIDAAVADGFDYFKNYNVDEPYASADSAIEIRTLCWKWTYMCALREIVHMDKCVMLLIDEILPVQTWDWDRLNRLVSECDAADKRNGRGFKGLQLRHKCTPFRKLPNVPYYSSMLREGLWGINENGYVFSRSGARMFLNAYAQFFPEEIISITEMLAKRGITNKQYRDGWWTVLDEVIDDNYRWKSDLWLWEAV